MEDSDAQHTLLMQQSANGNIFYKCLQCDSGYTSIEDFEEAHRFVEEMDADYYLVEESEWGHSDLEVEASEKKHKLADAPTKETLVVVDDEEVVCNVQYLEEEQASETPDTSEKFYCAECQVVLNDEESAEQHVCPVVDSAEEDNAPQPEQFKSMYVCFTCNKYFGEIDELKDHRLSCATSVKEEVNVKNVKRSKVKKNGKHKCPHCELRFTNAKVLNGHKRVHITDNNKPADEGTEVKEVKAATCNVCNTEFTSVKNLKLHMKIHDKNRPIKSIQEVLPEFVSEKYKKRNQFHCDICKKSFDQTLFTVHNKMHQKKNVSGGQYLCQKCNRNFEDLSSFELHQQMHQNQTTVRQFPVSKVQDTNSKHSFPCQYCGHVFARPHEKVKHERIHTGEKPYECEVCFKTFRVSYSLTLHLRSHTNIRPFVCATCNKRFKSQPVYMQHMKTHSDVKSYKCEDCEKSFRTRIQLSNHKNSHSKPFKCTECNRIFSTLYAANIHMKTHTKSGKPLENQYRCKCGAEYSRLFALRNHMKDQHGDESDTDEVKAEEATDSSTAEYGNDDLSETEEATKQLTQTEHYRLVMEEELLENNQQHNEAKETIGKRRIIKRNVKYVRN